MPLDKASLVRAWCERQVGCPYVYGGTGQPCTPAYRRARAAQYPQYAEKIKRNCPRLKGSDATCDGCVWYDQAAGKGKPVYDCAQLTRRAMEQVGISLVSGANPQWEKTVWAERGAIETLPRNRVALVFRRDGDHMGHTGVCLGDGTVIHAKGHDWGVVRQPLRDTKMTHWGIPAGLHQNGNTEEPIMAYPALRRGDTGEAVARLQTMLAHLGEPLAADGVFGAKTDQALRRFQQRRGLAVDGVCGSQTWAALEAATGHQDGGNQDGQPADAEPATVTISKSDWDTIRSGYAAVAGVLKKYESGERDRV